MALLVSPDPPGPSLARESRGWVVAAVMLLSALSALDVTIVGTAVPTIVGRLGGLALLPWLVAAFLLTSTTTVPVWGKLADLYGRKPVLLIGTGLFVLGSALCSLAGSMAALIAFRAVQGLGAGSIAPVTLALVGDQFTLEERGRLQGLFSGVWGVSSILGPLAGGLIVSTIGWPWIFLVNVPFGAAALALIQRFLQEPGRPAGPRPRIDALGALLLMAGLAGVLLALSLAAAPAGREAVVGGLAAGGLALLVAFARHERHVPEPVVYLPMLRHRVLGIATLAAFLSSGVLIGADAFLPLFVQGVWQGTPLEAGLALAPMSLGWLLASSAAGWGLLRWGYRPITGAGALLVLLGAGTWLLLGLDRPVWLLPLGALIAGLGFGLFNTALSIAVQDAVGWAQRGAASSLFQFANSFGQTVAVTVLGAALTAGLSARLAALPPSLALPGAAAASGQLGPASVLLDPVQRGSLDPATRLALQGVLGDTLGTVLLLMAGLALLALLAIRFFPRLRAGAPAGAAPASLDP